jgi:hypothetical protein
MRRIAAVLLALAAAPASAFIPEGGVWWNPAESGRGLTLEVQDNVLIFSGYLYRADGAPTWVTSAGPITYTYNVRGDLQTVVYSGALDTYSGGQCLGCPYRAPAAQPGAAGPVRIDFRTETEANLTWGGQTIPIERFSTLGDRTARMQGEWQVVLDFSNRGNTSEWPYRNYPFFGDVLLFDRVATIRGLRQFLGCRPESTIKRCTTEALRDHDAAGSYDATERGYAIIVKDIPGTFSSRPVFFAYFVNAGLDQFDGVMSIYREGGDPEDGPFYPVRGFRSASKTYAQTGFGPASADDGKALGGPPTGLSEKLMSADGLLPPGLTLDEAQARTGLDIRALSAQLPQVLAGMNARAQSAD